MLTKFPHETNDINQYMKLTKKFKYVTVTYFPPQNMLHQTKACSTRPHITTVYTYTSYAYITRNHTLLLLYLNVQQRHTIAR